MTIEKAKRIDDILDEAKEIACPVRRTLYFVNEFLKGPMCGRCFPCSFGSFEAKQRLKNITSAMGGGEDIDALREIGNKMLIMSMCKKGKDTAKVILENLEHPAFAEHLRGLCHEKECKAFIEYRNVPENCIRCGACKDACKFDAIIGEKQISYKCCYLPFEIRQKRCTKCGECIKVCPTNAIIIVNTEAEEEPVKA